MKLRLHKWVMSLIACVLLLLPTSFAAQAADHYVIATDTTFAPFEFQNASGEYVGIDMDLLKAIAEKQGFTYELKPLGFNAAVQALESQQVDGVIAGMTITEARKASFDFSESYYESGLIFATKADASIQSLADLKGKKIAVKNGTAGADLAAKLKDEYQFTIMTFEDSANMYEEVTTGNSDALVEDAPVIQYAIKNGGLPLKTVGEKLETSQTGFAVSKGKNSALLAAFNKGLADLKASGEYQTLLDRYIGADSETTAQTGFIGQLVENGPALLSGLWTTLWTAFVAVAIALVLGVLLGLMRVQANPLVAGIASIYIDLMRGIPLIVLSFFIYFGIPQMTGLRFSAAFAGIVTLSLNAAAYVAEIVRGGINAIDKGQMEASRSLGLSYGKTMRKIILPQAFKLMVPSFINQFVITLKDTSILSVIGLVELTQTGRVIIARTYQSGSMWLIVGLMYLIVITALTRLSKYLEGGK